MNNFIHINDFLDAHELENLQVFFEENVSWTYGWQSVVGEAPFSHWNHDFLKTKRLNQEDCAAALTGDGQLAVLASLWKKLEERVLHGHALVRCYANAHTYGIEGYPHVDAKIPGNFTTIFYLNPVWKPDWAGETVFLNAENDIERAVLPRPGRMISFDGTIAHAARAVSRSCPAMRVTLMFKSLAPDPSFNLAGGEYPTQPEK
jgi:hypothetical protein